MIESSITGQEFMLFQRLIYEIAGINLADSKQTMLVGRLQKRLQHYGLDSYAHYYRMVTSGQRPDELQTMVDLLTTHETYFFREAQHFDFLRDEILAKRCDTRPFRAWSAASSSGEEAYSIAMTLAEHLHGAAWEVVGSDIGSHVLEKARRALYPLERIEDIPSDFLKHYCLKGVRSQAGNFLVKPELCKRVSFRQINLTLPIDPRLGRFEVIFLRNVIIYFDMETKRKVIRHLLPQLASGGYLIVGHAETLNGFSEGLSQLRPTIYRKV